MTKNHAFSTTNVALDNVATKKKNAANGKCSGKISRMGAQGRYDKYLPRRKKGLLFVVKEGNGWIMMMRWILA